MVGLFISWGASDPVVCKMKDLGNDAIRHVALDAVAFWLDLTHEPVGMRMTIGANLVVGWSFTRYLAMWVMA